MEEDTNIYRKVGRKYIPIGVYERNCDYLTEGIWIVRRKPGMLGITSGNWLKTEYTLDKVGELPVADFPKIATMEEYADVVVNVITDNKYKTMSYMDLSRKIVDAMFNYKPKAKK